MGGLLDGLPFGQPQQPQPPTVSVHVKKVMLPDGCWYSVEEGSWTMNPQQYSFMGRKIDAPGSVERYIVTGGAFLAIIVSDVPIAKDMPPAKKVR